MILREILNQKRGIQLESVYRSDSTEVCMFDVFVWHGVVTRMWSLARSLSLRCNMCWPVVLVFWLVGLRVCIQEWPSAKLCVYYKTVLLRIKTICNKLIFNKLRNNDLVVFYVGNVVTRRGKNEIIIFRKKLSIFNQIPNSRIIFFFF